jgi:hypothetical protein
VAPSSFPSIVLPMARNTQHRQGVASEADGRFFAYVLIVLIGSTLFSGGTALMLARAASNQAAVTIAELPETPSDWR